MKRNTRLFIAYASIRRHYPAEMRKELADEIRFYRSRSCGAEIVARLYGGDALSTEPERMTEPLSITNWSSTDIEPLKPAIAAIVANDGRSPLSLDGVLTLTRRDSVTWTVTVAKPAFDPESADSDQESEKTTSPFAS